MIAIPAVDLRDGDVVQLVGGDYDREVVRLPDPSAVAARWMDLGFTRLHVVDLDAATGRGSNRDIVLQLVRRHGAEIQAGGGLRSSDDVADLLECGAACAVVGTRAISDRPWLAALAGEYPGRIAVALDVRGREVVTHGWAKGSGQPIDDVVDALDSLPLASLLVTAVHREGQMNGTDRQLIEDVVAATAHPVVASGGVASLDELRNLARAGVAGVVLGTALYSGTLDPVAVAREFGR